MDAIIGRKIGMTQLFAEDGTATPVTVIEAGPCPVVQVRAGHAAGAAQRVQLGFETARAKLSTKAERAHAAKAGLQDAPKILREFPAPEGGELPAPGTLVTVAQYAAGEKVKVTGPIPLPTKTQKWTVLRSPHVDKKSREQFELKTHKRLIDINDSRPQTVDALTKLDLPAGVDVEIKVE